ncbi:phage tail protein, P2 protein I family [Cohnella sp. OV330]|uniref:phage tail protein I n=1 Tax=Cohnella sp. OV330 TaxID=1855288 RepID=UPI0008EC1A1A|nr:phage tail protein I [Cohnella sp. OV330]SFA91399.1 phage tail protein, P2 protein I family [Cohnella sp. OV330]
MINLANASLLDILPPNLTEDPTIAAAAKALDAQRQNVLAAIDRLPYFSRLGELTDEEANELAWQWHVDFYDPDLPLEQRRSLVKNAYAWHKRKGTKSAIEELIRTIFGDGQVQEWFEYGGNPGNYRILTTNTDTTSTNAAQFLDALSTVTRASAHLEEIQATVSDEMSLYYAGFAHIGDFITLKQVT